jgi:FdhD protein
MASLCDRPRTLQRVSRGRTAKVLTHRYDGGGVTRQPDQLIVEEPLEIQLDGVLVSTTMRTPGHDFELAAGFCFTEGLLAGAPVRQCRYCGTGSAVDSEFNVVTVETGGLAPPPRPRLTTTTSACGMCGTTAVDDLRERLHPLPPTAPFSLDVLARVPDTVAATQQLFDATGAVHAAVAFDRDGTPVLGREDIGRHNAVDKVVGRFLLDGRLPATGLGLYASGRASFEIVQKAWAAGFSTVVAVSAPSSLAVSAARLAGMTLCGFARRGRLNVYAPEELSRYDERAAGEDVVAAPSAAASKPGR